MPRGAEKADGKSKLGVVIGKEAKYVGGARGTFVRRGLLRWVNDLSERAFQLEGTGQWVKG